MPLFLPAKYMTLLHCSPLATSLLILPTCPSPSAGSLLPLPPTKSILCLTGLLSLDTMRFNFLIFPGPCERPCCTPNRQCLTACPCQSSWSPIQKLRYETGLTIPNLPQSSQIHANLICQNSLQQHSYYRH